MHVAFEGLFDRGLHLGIQLAPSHPDAFVLKVTENRRRRDQSDATPLGLHWGTDERVIQKSVQNLATLTGQDERKHTDEPEVWQTERRRINQSQNFINIILMLRSSGNGPGHRNTVTVTNVKMTYPFVERNIRVVSEVVQGQFTSALWSVGVAPLQEVEKCAKHTKG